MLYNRWGSPVEIVANCGNHPYGTPSRRKTGRLVSAKWLDSGIGGTRFYFAEHLSADGGIQEVFKRADAAPEVDLGDDLERAIAQAK